MKNFDLVLHFSPQKGHKKILPIEFPGKERRRRTACVCYIRKNKKRNGQIESNLAQN
jgi:hypothetical protein